MASEIDSVAPDVNVTVRGVAPITRAVCSRAFVTASSAVQPSACSLEALPKCWRKNGSMASSTRSSTGVVAL